MKNLYRIIPIALMALLISCSGGGPSGNTIIPEPPGGSSNLVGGFQAAQPNPGNGTVSMSEGSATSGDVVMVQINVTGIDNLFGVNIDVVYNTALADFLGEYHDNSILASGGNSVSSVFSEPQPGTIVGGIARNGAGAGGMDVVGTQELVTLAFRVTGAGNSTISVQNESCVDADLQAIPGLGWSGGTLLAN
jgi:hypothetical protein